jgi:hypothetical protein
VVQARPHVPLCLPRCVPVLIPVLCTISWAPLGGVRDPGLFQRVMRVITHVRGGFVNLPLSVRAHCNLYHYCNSVVSCLIAPVQSGARGPDAAGIGWGVHALGLGFQTGSRGHGSDVRTEARAALTWLASFTGLHCQRRHAKLWRVLNDADIGLGFPSASLCQGVSLPSLPHPSLSCLPCPPLPSVPASFCLPMSSPSLPCPPLPWPPLPA